MSYIYVIASNEQGPTKIGLSATPEQRLKQLQTGHPVTLKLFYTEEFAPEKIHLVEKAIHKELRHLRSKGEWFNLPVDKAILEVKFALIHHGD